MNNKIKPKGFIAIISLMIITTVSMIFAMSMLKDGIRNAGFSLNSIYYENARINMNICLEDTLLRIKYKNQFNENLNYIISDANACTTEITWLTPEIIAQGITETPVNLKVTGINNSFSRTFLYALKITKFDINNSDGSIEYLNKINFISINELTE